MLQENHMSYKVNDQEYAESKAKRRTVIYVGLETDIKERDVQKDENLFPQIII